MFPELTTTPVLSPPVVCRERCTAVARCAAGCVVNHRIQTKAVLKLPVVAAAQQHRSPLPLPLVLFKRVLDPRLCFIAGCCR